MKKSFLLFLFLGYWSNNFPQEIIHPYGFPFYIGSDESPEAKLKCLDIAANKKKEGYGGLSFYETTPFTLAYNNKKVPLGLYLENLIKSKRLKISAYPCSNVDNAMAFYNGITKESFILWNKDFFNSFEEKSGVIALIFFAHEIGHIANKHIVNRSEFNKCLKDCRLKGCSNLYEGFRRMEYEADVYAGYALAEYGISNTFEVEDLFRVINSKIQFHEEFEPCAKHPDFNIRNLAMLEGFRLFFNHQNNDFTVNEKFASLEKFAEGEIIRLKHNLLYLNVRQLFGGQNLQIKGAGAYISYGRKDLEEKMNDEKYFTSLVLATNHNWARKFTDWVEPPDDLKSFNPTFRLDLKDLRHLRVYRTDGPREELFYQSLFTWDEVDRSFLLGKIKLLFWEAYKEFYPKLESMELLPPEEETYTYPPRITLFNNRRFGGYTDEVLNSITSDSQMELLNLSMLGLSAQGGGYLYNDGNFFIAGPSTVYNAQEVNDIRKKYNIEGRLLSVSYGNGFFADSDLTITKDDLIIYSWRENDLLKVYRNDTKEVFFETQYRVTSSLLETYAEKVLGIYLELVEDKVGILMGKE
tara:strand:+ start:2748 stop:4490 length:1743 start_codon:yes stop_codon:yes gene_type:complete